MFFSWAFFVLIKHEDLFWNCWVLGDEMILYNSHQACYFHTMKPHWMIEELCYMDKDLFRGMLERKLSL